MDNDSKGVKMLKSVYRKIRFKQSYYCLDVKNNKWEISIFTRQLCVENHAWLPVAELLNFVALANI